MSVFRCMVPNHEGFTLGVCYHGIFTENGSIKTTNDEGHQVITSSEPFYEV